MNNNGDNGFKYPYYAQSPVDGKRKLFKSKKDVYRELEMCYDEIMENNVNAIGETLYTEHFFFCNTCELIDHECQKTIKKYNYCKTFNTPLYPSLDETPANIVDDFMRIDKEYNAHRAQSLNHRKGSE